MVVKLIEIIHEADELIVQSEHQCKRDKEALMNQVVDELLEIENKIYQYFQSSANKSSNPLW